MAAPRLIPCLDVRDGRVVKGIRFQDLRDAGDPVTQAATYQGQGADEIVILDVSATPEGRGNAVETTSSVRRVLSIPLTVGGGVREVEDALALLEAGADKVAVNTAAVQRPELVDELADRFGSQCTVLAVDAARRADGGWEVVVNGGRTRAGRDVEGWVRSAATRGAGEILLTSWDRDGTRSGYDLELIEAVTATVDIPVIASGGADNAAHLKEALSSGATAVLIASILHDGVTTVDSLKRQLVANGTEVRP
jgi:cyclase